MNETGEPEHDPRLIKTANGAADMLKVAEKRAPTKNLTEMTLAELRHAMNWHLRFRVYPPIRRPRTQAAAWAAVRACAARDFERKIKLPAPKTGNKRRPTYRPAEQIVEDLSLLAFAEALDEMTADAAEG